MDKLESLFVELNHEALPIFKIIGHYHELIDHALRSFDQCHEMFKVRKTLSGKEINDAIETFETVLGGIRFVRWRILSQIQENARANSDNMDNDKKHELCSLITEMLSSHDSSLPNGEYFYAIKPDASVWRCPGLQKISNTSWCHYRPAKHIDLRYFGFEENDLFVDEKTAEMFITKFKHIMGE